eukprot:scaffold85868_cov31-Phaeocystis_antarctica.AAC.2
MDPASVDQTWTYFCQEWAFNIVPTAYVWSHTKVDTAGDLDAANLSRRLPLGTAAPARAPRPASRPSKSTTPASLPPSRRANASAGAGVPAERVQRRCRVCAAAV